MCSDKNPNNVLKTISCSFILFFICVFTLGFIWSIIIHYLGVLYCYLGIESCLDKIPYMAYGIEFILILLIILFGCFFIFKVLDAIYNDISSSFKTNEEIEKFEKIVIQ
jgi:hypothetical protein